MGRVLGRLGQTAPWPGFRRHLSRPPLGHVRARETTCEGVVDDCTTDSISNQDFGTTEESAGERRWTGDGTRGNVRMRPGTRPRASQQGLWGGGTLSRISL